MPIHWIMKTYSMDLRERVLAACDAKEDTRKEIAKRFKISESWIYYLLRRRRETGKYASWDSHAGRKPIFEGKSLKKLKALVDQQPDRTLEELRQLSGKNCSIMAVWRGLEKLGSRYKKRPLKPVSKSGRMSSKSAGRGSRK